MGKNYSLNLGIDLSFINRIFASLEYYNRDTKDLLYSLPHQRHYRIYQLFEQHRTLEQQGNRI